MIEKVQGTLHVFTRVVEDKTSRNNIYDVEKLHGDPLEESSAASRQSAKSILNNHPGTALALIMIFLVRCHESYVGVCRTLSTLSKH